MVNVWIIIKLYPIYNYIFSTVRKIFYVFYLIFLKRKLGKYVREKNGKIRDNNSATLIFLSNGTLVFLWNELLYFWNFYFISKIYIFNEYIFYYVIAWEETNINKQQYFSSNFYTKYFFVCYWITFAKI